MNKLQSLIDLRDKVKAGKIEKAPFWKVWLPENPDGHLAWSAKGAANGSLDAAKALHEAVLPGWARAVDATLPEAGVDVEIFGWSGQRIKGTDIIESRAWLLAILEALIAQED